MEGEAYTLAVWRIKPGLEDEFVELWKGDLAAFFLGLPNPPGNGTLVRSVEDPQLFYSFGPWRSLDDIKEMRANPQTQEVMGRLANLCDEAKPGAFRVVATAP